MVISLQSDQFTDIIASVKKINTMLYLLKYWDEILLAIIQNSTNTFELLSS